MLKKVLKIKLGIVIDMTYFPIELNAPNSKSS